MTPSARLSAAITILSDIESTRRPASLALKDWGHANRYAGAGDRSAVGNLVFDALRVRASAAWVMGEDTARAVMLGSLRRLRGLDAEAIAALCGADRFAPPALSADERHRLDSLDMTGASAPIAGDYPEWLDAGFARSFGETRIAEVAALAARAPLDLRVNALKMPRGKALEMLGHLGPAPTAHAPVGLRIEPNADGRVPYVQAEPAFLKGAIEVQDEGSQLASLFTGAAPGEQVLDFCAGAGGKSLAMAAMMNNTGQIFATDADARRLANSHERIKRAGARNIQVRTPKGGVLPLDDLDGRMDLVVVDAPCTGTGTWRRNPDAKWRIRPGSIDERLKEQRAVLAAAPRFVKPGGRLVYITCSLLAAENGDQIAAFLGEQRDFAAVPPEDVAAQASLPALAAFADPDHRGLLLTPLRTGTDGFFVAVLRRS